MAHSARSTDKDWERWGKENPYFGVLSHPKFLNSNLEDASLREFFLSGEQHVDHVVEFIRARIRGDFDPGNMLDYGCGVGRLLIPFARRAHTVVGVDVSPSMLEEARKNCQKFGVESARLLPVDEFWSLPPSTFDFVHTFIVLQHIPLKRGEEIIRKLVGLLVEGGVGAIHVTFSNDRNGIRNFLSGLRTHSSLLNGLFNLAKGQELGRPAMQMNSYSLNRIFEILMLAGCSQLNIEFSDHNGNRGVMIYFQKAPAPPL